MSEAPDIYVNFFAVMQQRIALRLHHEVASMLRALHVWNVEIGPRRFPLAIAHVGDNAHYGQPRRLRSAPETKPRADCIAVGHEEVLIDQDKGWLNFKEHALAVKNHHCGKLAPKYALKK